MDTVYVALGGNIGDAASTITDAAEAIQALPQIEAFNISRYYLTTPVSPIPQNHYVNAVCSFKTKQGLLPLFAELQKIEQHLGKGVKRKDAPRVIDLDLLFYGVVNFKGEDMRGSELRVPHNDWKDRLFVLLPLLDLTDEITITTSDGVKKINLKEHVKNFPNPHHETIIVLKENFYRGGDGTKRTS
ncbi:MAG: 2-amino-4-hydroxy-6-hydroxymethyldihydropteridine diphosphokinase [Parachlamydiaceae bacterium]|nr:2-amino-4-hydroxy-6-hydroxymethyldihydropteridine diphosphokinase [Parachlamydiaceae bacterium]